MSKNYSRKLGNTEEVEEFCRNILFGDVPEEALERGDYDDEIREAVRTIFDQEKLILELGDMPDNTFDSTHNRDPKCRKNAARENLREQIARECISQKRIAEEQVKLGQGGMLPNGDVKHDKQCYMVIGLPASGKSTISEVLSDLTGSVYLDADIVKRKLPEFYEDTRGASLVHKESNYILKPSSEYKSCPDYNIMLNCLQNESNIVYNTIGDDYDGLESIIQTIQEKGYTMHLILVELDRQKCVARAYRRFQKTKRYISLPLIFDVYANNPTISFFKCIIQLKIKSFAYIDNDVEMGEPKKIILNEFEDKEIIENII